MANLMFAIFIPYYISLLAIKASMFSKTFLAQTLPPKPSKLFLYKMGCLSSDDQCKWVGELILVFRLLYVCDPTQHEVVKSLKVCIFISKRNFPQNKNVVKLYIYPP